jgi:predicted GH43/DUF377 family glycosyl hydrolase
MIKFVGTALQDKQALLFYCQTEGNETFFKAVGSENGLEFSDKCNYIFVFDENQKEEQNFNWKNFRIAKNDGRFLLTYKIDQDKNSSLFGAFSTDLIRWQKIGRIDDIKETGTIIPNYKFNENYIMFFGEKEIKMAYSTDLRTWNAEKKAVIKPRKTHFDSGDLEVGNAYALGEHILLIYYTKKESNGKILYDVGFIIFDKLNPTQPIFRSEEAIFEHPEELMNEKMYPFGSAISNNQLVLYWLVGDNNLFAVCLPIPTINTDVKHKVYGKIVKKAQNNPIIGPNPVHPWESRAAFNSAAILDNGKVHFVYRALGDKDLSVLGYATSSDGINIDERSDEPIYIPREPFETPGGNAFSSFAQHFASGGGYGGIEDPRITRLEDKIYLTYVAFDGANPPRVAMSSIHIDDFRKKDWSKWEKPKLISAPGMVNKSAVIFPRKINNKYVMLHRVYPNILVDYLDNLDFRQYLQGQYFIPPRKKFWDSKKVGAGAPPMETDDGWLLIYQSVGHQDSSRYKIGAMMLDRDNPQKVLYRTHTPIIEPNERYENDGFKSGVVYPCGAVIKDGNLHVYYGGADTVVCAASADLNTFLKEMKKNKELKLTKVTGKHIAN